MTPSSAYSHTPATPHPDTSTNAKSQASRLRKSSASKFRSAKLSLLTGLTHLTASIANLRNGQSLLGMHYGLSAAGQVFAATSSGLSGFADLAKSRGQDQISEQFKHAAAYFQLGGSPVAGLGRCLRDVDTALTSLADPQKSAYEKQRDLTFAIGTILTTAGITHHAWNAFSGNPNAFVARCGTLLTNSGTLLRGIQNLQRNMLGLSDALEQSNPRNIASYSSGTVYGLGESLAGFGHAVAQALKESGYSEASQALSGLAMHAQDVGTMASNVQIQINTLWPIS